jgi:hypothetical protein
MPGKDMAKGVRIGLIHATPVAIRPIQTAMATLWPAAEGVNILDDSLSVDRAAAHVDEAAISARIEMLGKYAEAAACRAVLFTCSAFSHAIERTASLLPIPVLKPNEAMFRTAIRQGGKTAMLYTFPPAREGMEQEFRDEAAQCNSDATLTSFLVEGAMEALRGGDVARHDGLVADAAARLQGFDTIVMAHFSTSSAKQAVEAVVSVPVLTSPDAAVTMLKDLLRYSVPDTAVRP